jgi:transposase-like protein
LGIAEATLWNWVNALREAATRAGDPNALTESERDELRRLRKEKIALRTDAEILAEGCGVFRPRDDEVNRLPLRLRQPAEFSVKRMCQLLGVPRSPF